MESRSPCSTLCAVPYREQALDSLLERRAELRAEVAAIDEHIRAMRRERRAAWLEWTRPVLHLLLFTVIALTPITLVLGVAVLPTCACSSRIEDARTDAQSIRGGVEMYLAQYPSARCPCVHDLVEERILGARPRTRDPWDHDFHVECRGEDVTVTSAGPDGRFGTEDDVS